MRQLTCHALSRVLARNDPHLLLILPGLACSMQADCLASACTLTETQRQILQGLRRHSYQVSSKCRTAPPRLPWASDCVE